MPRGGARPNAGRKKSAPEQLPKAGKDIASKVLAMAAPPIHQKECSCEVCAWWEFLKSGDLRIRFETRKYLTDRRDGKPAQAVRVSGQDGGPIQAKVVVEFVKPKK